MEANPYEAPRAQSLGVPGPEGSEFEGEHMLATRGARLGAVLIDSVAGVVVFFFVFVFLVVVLALAEITWIEDEDERGVIVSLVLGCVAWFVLQIPLLVKGQTFGKRLVGIRVVDASTGVPVSFARLVFLRGVSTLVMSNLPFIGLLDTLFIFGKEQRCIHDRIAGTKVVWS